MKRKSTEQLQAPRKRRKWCEPKQSQVQQPPVLAASYATVLDLRQYLIARLPVKCSRRRHLSKSFGDDVDAILDGWKVGVLSEPTPEVKRARSRDLVAFTQTQVNLSTHGTAPSQTCTLEDVLDFAIWQLFSKSTKTVTRPRHLLCNGFQRGMATDGSNGIPGVVQLHPNDNLAQVKTPAWHTIFAALGGDGESILTSLLLDCGLFSALDSGANNYYQVSGLPIVDLKNPYGMPPENAETAQQVNRSPSEINFVRSRMLYAKPSLNKRGHVRFGLKHIHIFQRCPDLEDGAQTVHIMKHIFPRQFRLHNVFTSSVDKRQTSQPFLDYVYREEEIMSSSKHTKTWLPPRLRCMPLSLVVKIRKLHDRCAYSQLFRHYCSLELPGKSNSPVNTSLGDTQLSSVLITQCRSTRARQPSGRSLQHTEDPDRSFLEHATPTVCVSAFCRAVFWCLLPNNAFGEGDNGRHNWSLILQHVDAFIRKRRFETMNLDQVCQRLRLGCISWLAPKSIEQGMKLSKQERSKRMEILSEFIYYLFDSLLIPLIQSNFYVTESGSQRNRLFYIRHDVWRKMAEPSFAMVRSGIYQQLKPTEIRRMINSKTLGYSHVRLLPKAEGTRTITNLRRRMTRIANGRRLLGPSINTQLAPIFSALSFERRQNPQRLGGAIFSVGGLHEKLNQFRTKVDPAAKLYFVKVDVQSCFDSIPQNQLLTMIQAIVKGHSYRTSKYAEVKPAGGPQTRQRFINLARPADSSAVFSKATAEEVASLKGGRVFTEVGSHKVWEHQRLLALLREHIQNNIVKVGKKHFRQKQGIPQGSVLSSMLCSFFYAAFEHNELGFLDPEESMLVRLIDDFLLITADKHTARMFLQVMTQQHELYGIAVNPQKTLANFEATVGMHKIPRHQGTSFFPYCGMAIGMASLQIGRDRERKDFIISNGLTVDLTKKAGSAFHRKVRLSFVQQMHRMLLDESLNSQEQILSTLLEAFSETTMKMHAYVRSMPRRHQPSQNMLIQMADELVHLAVRYACRQQQGGLKASETNLTHKHVVWALSTAIEHVLGPKQSNYRRLLQHVGVAKHGYEAGMGLSRKMLSRLTRRRDAVFKDYVY